MDAPTTAGTPTAITIATTQRPAYGCGRCTTTTASGVVPRQRSDGTTITPADAASAPVPPALLAAVIGGSAVAVPAPRDRLGRVTDGLAVGAPAQPVRSGAVAPVGLSEAAQQAPAVLGRLAAAGLSEAEAAAVPSEARPDHRDHPARLDGDRRPATRVRRGAAVGPSAVDHRRATADRSAAVVGADSAAARLHRRLLEAADALRVRLLGVGRRSAAAEAQAAVSGDGAKQVGDIK